MDGVAVLLKIYAHCIDGQADAADKRNNDALGHAEPGPMTRETATASKHPETLEQRQAGEANGLGACQWPVLTHRPLVVMSYESL